MRDQTVEGFANYATFGVAVTLENDRGAAQDIETRVRQAPMLAMTDENVPEVWAAEECIRFRLADWLKDYAERRVEHGIRTDGRLPSLLAAQMVQAGLAEVEWADLARHYLERWADA